MAAPTLGLRHAVLWVSDPAASAEFYADVLGLETKLTSPDAVFMASPSSLTDHDLGLFRASSEPARPRQVGLYHLSWEVPTLDETLFVEAGAGSGGRRTAAVKALFARARPDEGPFLVELFMGEVRQGALEGVILDAVARASGLPAADVRQAAMYSGDVGRVAAVRMRFAKPVFPGETIVTRAWKEGSRVAIEAVALERGENVVTQAWMDLRDSKA